MNVRASSFAVWAIVAFACALLIAACGRSNLDDYLLGDGGPTIDGGFDAHPEGGACNASTCPDGCCDAGGKCVDGKSIHACGGGGQLCSDCQKEGFAVCDVNLHACANVTRKCDETSCPNGCCEGDLCLPGSDQNECGNRGGACQHCSQRGLTCQNRLCTKQGCDPRTCKGCCFGEQCVSGLDQTACGFGGMQCQNCQAQGTACGPAANGGGMCEGPAQCNAQNCKGCCQNNVCIGGSTDRACGFGGVACQDCTSFGAVCSFQQCQPSTCNPSTCPKGCCDQFGKCEPGTIDSFCGFGGQKCQDCTQSGETCSGGICQNTSCGPQTCPTGCCSNGFCIGGGSNSACGTKGVACMDCAGSGMVCNGGSCVPPASCNAQTCPNGCCVGDVCAVGTGDNACGVKGQACQNCNALGEVCSNGACVPPPPKCNATTCPNGCCVGDVCAVGTQDTACGTGGVACSNCATQNATCNAGKCVPKPPSCTPQTCAGCCDANDTCQAGFLNNQCGQNGVACANCSAQGSTCDTAANPRVCSSQQSTCPAAYPSCPAGVSTPIVPVQHVCSASDLANARAACTGGAHSAACQSFMQFEQQQNPACAKCITPFDYDFQEAEGLFVCVAPYVAPSCDHTTGCAIDCETQSCAQCPAGSTSQCQQQVRTGQCQAYFQQSQCVAQAFFSSGSFCNPQNYGGNYGAWLQGVGGHYCGP